MEKMSFLEPAEAADENLFRWMETAIQQMKKSFVMKNGQAEK